MYNLGSRGLKSFVLIGQEINFKLKIFYFIVANFSTINIKKYQKAHLGIPRNDSVKFQGSIFHGCGVLADERKGQEKLTDRIHHRTSTW